MAWWGWLILIIALVNMFSHLFLCLPINLYRESFAEEKLGDDYWFILIFTSPLFLINWGLWIFLYKTRGKK